MRTPSSLASYPSLLQLTFSILIEIAGPIRLVESTVARGKPNFAPISVRQLSFNTVSLIVRVLRIV